MPHLKPPEIHENYADPWAGYFEGQRKKWRERFAARQPRPKRRAVQTIVYNEPVFLPIWLRYYSRFFAPEDIYVLDNETDDGSTDRDGFVRIPVSHGSVDHVWMADTLADHQRDLLDRYDVVVTTDVDEIVAPVPELGGLDDYLALLEEEWVNCKGYEILHLPDREPPLDLSAPILDQRGFWFANGGYDKPAISTQPARWSPGLHWREDGERDLDPDLRMVHLHRMDFELCRARHELRSRRAWNEYDLEQGWAIHNRVTTGDPFEHWFFQESSFESMGIEIVLERIPPAWRGVF